MRPEKKAGLSLSVIQFVVETVGISMSPSGINKWTTGAHSQCLSAGGNLPMHWIWMQMFPTFVGDYTFAK